MVTHIAILRRMISLLDIGVLSMQMLVASTQSQLTLKRAMKLMLNTITKAAPHLVSKMVLKKMSQNV